MEAPQTLSLSLGSKAPQLIGMDIPVLIVIRLISLERDDPIIHKRCDLLAEGFDLFCNREIHVSLLKAMKPDARRPQLSRTPSCRPPHLTRAAEAAHLNPATDQAAVAGYV